MIKESTLQPETAVYREIVPAGDYFMKTVNQGQIFRILDLEGNQAADTLFYNAADPTERYSAMDTIREQGNVYLTAGTKLISNENNVMLEIVADTVTIRLAVPVQLKVIQFAMHLRKNACMPVVTAGCWL